MTCTSVVIINRRRTWTWLITRVLRIKFTANSFRTARTLHEILTWVTLAKKMSRQSGHFNNLQQFTYNVYINYLHYSIVYVDHHSCHTVCVSVMTTKNQTKAHTSTKAECNSYIWKKKLLTYLYTTSYTSVITLLYDQLQAAPLIGWIVVTWRSPQLNGVKVTRSS